MSEGWFVVWGKLVYGSEQTIVGWVCGGDKPLLIGGSVGKLGPRRSVAFGNLRTYLVCPRSEPFADHRSIFGPRTVYIMQHYVKASE